MKKIILIFILFLLTQKIYAINDVKIPFFIPPEKWEIVNPKHYPPYVIISFIKKDLSTCRPTINLAVQKTSLTLDEYTNQAKKIHIKEPDTSFKILDRVDLSDAKAIICEIRKKIDSIDFNILQMICVKNDNAYVLTGACKKEEILNNYQMFTDVFNSFKIIDNLFSLVPEKDKQEELINIVKQTSDSLKHPNKKENKKKLSSFEKYLEKKFANLGKYFQVLLIQRVQN